MQQNVSKWFKMNKQVDHVELRVYRKRWLVLALLVWTTFLLTFTFVNFGYLNNVMVAYFNTSYAAVDWILLGCNSGTVAAAPFVGWFAFKNILSAKKSMVIACGLLIIGFSCIIIGFLRPILYFLVVLGQFLNGVAGAVLYSLPAVMAQIWFEEYQIGVATGIGMLGVSTASITGDVLPPFVIKTMPTKNSTLLNNGTTWIEYDKKFYQTLYLTMLVTAVVILILLVSFIPEKPEHPPSMSQYLKRIQAEQTQYVSFRDYLKEIRSLVFDYKFIAGNITGSLVYQMYYFDELSAELIVSKLTLSFNALSPEQISGIIIATISMGTVLANILSGILLDKFKKYYLQSNVSAWLVLLTSITNLVSVHYRNFPALMVSMFLFGLTKRTCFIAIIDFLMQHTYPKNPLFVMSFAIFLQNLLGLLFVNIGRQVIYHAGLINGLIYACIAMFLGCIACLFFKPDTSRLDAEVLGTEATQTVSETSPLLIKQNRLAVPVSFSD